MTEVCILNDPDLGIISENDHRVGLCLCHKCSCGKHKCVYRKLFSRISLRHKSSYRAFSIPLKFRKIIPVSASKKSSPSRKLKFISQSTYKEDCLPDRDFKTIDNRNIFKPNYKFKTGRSSYNDEYTAKPLETLKPCVPFKPSKVSVGEFQGQSTYKSDFIKGDNRKPFRYKSVPKLKIFSDVKMYTESTNQRDYKALEGYKTGILARPQTRQILFTSTNFKTTNQRDFQAPASSVKDLPRRFASLNY